MRGGEDNRRRIFTEYTGTISSDAVEALIPTAEGDFDAVLTISEDGELRRADLTGVFYDDAGELTYTLELLAQPRGDDLVVPRLEIDGVDGDLVPVAALMSPCCT